MNSFLMRLTWHDYPVYLWLRGTLLRILAELLSIADRRVLNRRLWSREALDTYIAGEAVHGRRGAYGKRR